MHQYKIVYTAYTEDGAPTNDTNYVYADSAEQARNKYEEQKRKRYENGFAMYKVELQVAAYKTIADPATFFTQFEI